MTDEQARLAGEVNGLRIALRFIVIAMSVEDHGPAMISGLKRLALEVVETSSRKHQCPELTVFNEATREAVDFIFSLPDEPGA